MYPPRPQPSVKEQEESGRRIINVALAILGLSSGLLFIFLSHQYFYGALNLTAGISWTASAVLDRRNVSKRKRRFIGLAELGIFLLVIGVYLMLRRSTNSDFHT
jgi:Na+/H+ antiporter NhaD/arsenite permease-like protein